MSGLRSLVADQLRASRVPLVGALIAVLVSCALVTAGPIVFRYGFDEGVGEGDRDALRLAVAISAGLLVAGGLVNGVRLLLMAIVGQRFLHEVRRCSAAGVLRMDLAAYEASPRGDLQARMTSDVESLTNAAESYIPDTLRDLVMVVGGLLAVGLLSPPLLGLALLAIPPAVLAGRWLLRRGRIVYPEQLRANGVALGRLVETVQGAPTVSAFRAQGRALSGLRRAGHEHATAANAAASMRNVFYGTLLLLQSAGTAAVVVGAGLVVDRGSISVGTAAAAILALAGVYGPLSWAIGRLDDLLLARAALMRVAALIDVPERPGSGDALAARAPLGFFGVSYGYPGADALALERVTFTVAPGEHVALVGATGSGKSTIARLAVGLATPSAGTVRLSGVEVSAAAEDDRRRRLLLVPQESFLISGTVADNARLADPGLSDAAVEAAVDELGLRAWVTSLPEGIATDVGPAGAALSTGERQLVTLLRVALADPAVLVLDEATSVLDPESERAVAEALGRLSAGRAVLVIAHRRDTAARCDRILVLADGRVVAAGTHAELSAADGPYTQLWARA